MKWPSAAEQSCGFGRRRRRRSNWAGGCVGRDRARNSAGDGGGNAAALVPAAITAGLDYLIVGGTEFIGRNNDFGYNAGTTGVFTTTAASYIDCNFGLPIGSTLKEMEVFASGTGSLAVSVYRVSPTGSSVTSIGSVAATAATPGTMTFTEAVDGNSVYLIEIGNTSACCCVSRRPESVSSRPIAAS